MVEEATAGVDYVEALASEGRALVAAMRRGPLDAPVETCPGWDMTALAGHIGTTWHWAAQIVNERLDKPAPYAVPDALQPQDVVPYLESGLAALVDALRSCPPETPVWGFGPKPRTAAFWPRRQAMETAVHRVDAELAIGRPAPVDRALASDGVGEFIENMLPRMYYGREAPAGQLRVSATDSGRTWVQGDPAAQAGTLAGTAEDLFLVLWGRRDAAAVQAGGDAQTLAAWRAVGAP